MKECNNSLKQLLEDVVIPDIEDAIDDIFENINSKKDASNEDQDELDELYEMKKEFTLILDDIQNDELNEEECKELLNEISEMISEEN
jgi:hypothetical protein